MIYRERFPIDAKNLLNLFCWENQSIFIKMRIADSALA